MVVEYGHNAQSFTSPFKSIVKTLIMTLGEYEFDALYEGFMDHNYIDQVFALSLSGKDTLKI